MNWKSETKNWKSETNKTLAGILTILFLGVSCAREPADEGRKQEVGVASAKMQPVSVAERQALNQRITDGRHTAITNAVARVSDAVCGITVTQNREYRRSPFYDDPFFRYFFPERVPRRTIKSLGSGFLISPDGYIVTNEHVVQNAAKIVVSLADGRTQNARVIGEDYTTDIALLKIEGNDYKYLEFGDSENVIIGEWVIALGNPFGLFEINAKPTVTVGVISALDRDFGKQTNDRVYQDMIQTDAAINRGNSGGPLVNSLGEVIGMNTFIFSGSDMGSIGLGFAIPINRIRRIMADLREHGKVDRSWTTGIIVENISPLVADYFKLTSRDGVIVTDVERHSPAERAGLEVGDIITEINGQAVRNRDDIWTVIEESDLRAGDEIVLKVQRDRRASLVKFKLEGITN